MSRRLPALVGTTSFLLAAAVSFLPSGGPAPVGAPALAAELPGYSYLTGEVSSDPAGRAAALFQFGFGVEFLDFPQAVVVGADAPTARRLDAAQDRAGPETQGDPAPMLLSPDGTRVAVGDHDTDQPELLLVDLTTGDADTLPLPDGRSALPLAWSPDGTRIAYLTTPEPSNPYSGVTTGGDLGILDVTTGLATPVPGATGVFAVAFSPDGTRLAVQRADLTIVEPDGTVLRRVEVPPSHRLDGANAWSPDGALLATSLGVSSACSLDDPDTYVGCTTQYAQETAFVDATGSGVAVPERLPQVQLGHNRVIGWTGPDRVLVLARVDDSGPYRLLEVPLRGGDPRLLSEIPTADGNFGVGAFQLATALLPELQTVDAPAADHGPWPVPLRIGAAAAVGLTAAAVVAFTRRRPPPAPAPQGTLATTPAGPS